ncbi:MAG: hypothetical protein K6E51_09130 [Treponema sp.]|nr:hypothetical protein [Treponema sp.]
MKQPPIVTRFAITILTSLVLLCSCKREIPTEVIKVTVPTNVITDTTPSTDYYIDQYYGQPTKSDATVVKQKKGADGIDLDLTKQSSTMVYSQVFNMMISPEDFIGKTIKMQGLCSVYHDEEDNKDYYACIIMDATACCAQGIDFELKAGLTYPSDNEKITITGVFEQYTVKGYESFHLARATLD